MIALLREFNIFVKADLSKTKMNFDIERSDSVSNSPIVELRKTEISLLREIFSLTKLVPSADVAAVEKEIQRVYDELNIPAASRFFQKNLSLTTYKWFR